MMVNFEAELDLILYQTLEDFQKAVRIGTFQRNFNSFDSFDIMWLDEVFGSDDEEDGNFRMVLDQYAELKRSRMLAEAATDSENESDYGSSDGEEYVDSDDEETRCNIKKIANHNPNGDLKLIQEDFQKMLSLKSLENLPVERFQDLMERLASKIDNLNDIFKGLENNDNELAIFRNMVDGCTQTIRETEIFNGNLVKFQGSVCNHSRNYVKLIRNYRKERKFNVSRNLRNKIQNLELKVLSLEKQNFLQSEKNKSDQLLIRSLQREIEVFNKRTEDLKELEQSKKFIENSVQCSINFFSHQQSEMSQLREENEKLRCLNENLQKKLIELQAMKCCRVCHKNGILFQDN